MPTVLPNRKSPRSSRRAHSPLRRRLSPRFTRLSSISSKPMVASATAMKFSFVGLLATSTPSRVAAGTSILSTPMKGTMTRPRCSACSMTDGVTRSRCEASSTSAARTCSISSDSA